MSTGISKTLKRSRKAYFKVRDKLTKGAWIETPDGPGMIYDVYFPVPVPLDHAERKYREFWYLDLKGRFHGSIMHDIGTWCEEITVYAQIGPSTYKLFMLSQIQPWEGAQAFAPAKPSKSTLDEYTLR